MDELPEKAWLADGRTAYLLWCFQGPVSPLEHEPQNFVCFTGEESDIDENHTEPE